MEEEALAVATSAPVAARAERAAEEEYRARAMGAAWVMETVAMLVPAF